MKMTMSSKERAYKQVISWTGPNGRHGMPGMQVGERVVTERAATVGGWAESFELVAFLCHRSGEAGNVCVETVALSCAVGSGSCGVPCGLAPRKSQRRRWTLRTADFVSISEADFHGKNGH